MAYIIPAYKIFNDIENRFGVPPLLPSEPCPEPVKKCIIASSEPAQSSTTTNLSSAAAPKFAPIFSGWPAISLLNDHSTAHYTSGAHIMTLNEHEPYHNAVQSSRTLYSRDSLVLERRAIRILALAPGTGDEPLRGEVIVPIFDHANLHYTALSYDWFQPERECTVSMGRALLHTTLNTKSALHHIREPIHPKNLSVGINRRDFAKMHAQVSLMVDMYVNAHRTLLLLGDDFAYNDLAIIFIRTFGHAGHFELRKTTRCHTSIQWELVMSPLRFSSLPFSDLGSPNTSRWDYQMNFSDPLPIFPADLDLPRFPVWPEVADVEKNGSDVLASMCVHSRPGRRRQRRAACGKVVEDTEDHEATLGIDDWCEIFQSSFSEPWLHAPLDLLSATLSRDRKFLSDSHDDTSLFKDGVDSLLSLVILEYSRSDLLTFFEGHPQTMGVSKTFVESIIQELTDAMRANGDRCEGKNDNSLLSSLTPTDPQSRYGTSGRRTDKALGRSIRDLRDSIFWPNGLQTNWLESPWALDTGRQLDNSDPFLLHERLAAQSLRHRLKHEETHWQASHVSACCSQAIANLYHIPSVSTGGHQLPQNFIFHYRCQPITSLTRLPHGFFPLYEGQPNSGDHEMVASMMESLLLPFGLALQSAPASFDDLDPGVSEKSTQTGVKGFESPESDKDPLHQPAYEHAGSSTSEDYDSTKVIGRNSRQDPVLYQDIIVSGDMIIKDPKLRDEIGRQRHGVIIAFAMEAAGPMDQTHPFVIRVITDYADSHQTQIRHPYVVASETTSLLKSFFLSTQPSSSSSTTTTTAATESSSESRHQCAINCRFHEIDPLIISRIITANKIRWCHAINALRLLSIERSPHSHPERCDQYRSMEGTERNRTIFYVRYGAARRLLSLQMRVHERESGVERNETNERTSKRERERGDLSCLVHD